jgi:hypothetical protein
LEKKNILVPVRIKLRLLECPVFGPVKNYDLAVLPPSSLLLSVDLVLEVGGKWKSNMKELVREEEVTVI